MASGKLSELWKKVKGKGQPAEEHEQVRTDEERGLNGEVGMFKHELWVFIKILRSSKMSNIVVRQALLKANLVFCTLTSAGSQRVLRTLYERVKVLLVDEAGQASEAALLIAYAIHPRHLVLIGDPHQLPAFIMSDQAIKMGCQQSTMYVSGHLTVLSLPLQQSAHVTIISSSLQTKPKLTNLSPPFSFLLPSFFPVCRYRLMNKCDFQTNTLTTQYRMDPEICKLPNEIFYRGALKNSKEVTMRRNIVLDKIRDMLQCPLPTRDGGRDFDSGRNRDRDRSGSPLTAYRAADGGPGQGSHSHDSRDNRDRRDSSDKRQKQAVPEWLSNPFVFVDAPAGTTPGTREIGGSDDCPSFGNEQEAVLIAKICRYLKDRCNIRLKEQVNIITFYAKQVREIKQRLNYEGLVHQGGDGPKVSTVDSYQVSIRLTIDIS